MSVREQVWLFSTLWEWRVTRWDMLPFFSAHTTTMCQAASLEAYLTWRWDQAAASSLERETDAKLSRQGNRQCKCVSLCEDNLVWEKRNISCRSPSPGNQNKMSVKMAGFCCTYWATQPANICLRFYVRSMNWVALLLAKWQRKWFCCWTTALNSVTKWLPLLGLYCRVRDHWRSITRLKHIKHVSQLYPDASPVARKSLHAWRCLGTIPMVLHVWPVLKSLLFWNVHGHSGWHGWKNGHY